MPSATATAVAASVVQPFAVGGPFVETSDLVASNVAKDSSTTVATPMVQDTTGPA